ncbi:alpha/beta-hydrolase [Rickenella mellea]|uniref:Palmitoyl-protein thioesterase 1 n=1 Tax=Rickenella mellea TaxID=50990 RepID=A0A4Y7PRY1_9AGAM|nr:alpha/beta-hydrolase [Rickenella mellea]
MLEFASLIKDIHPGIFVYSIYIKEDLDGDQRAGFFGNVDEQLEEVAQQLADVDDLRKGFDAIGFSQGGQFLRAYVELYNEPPIHNLITFGSQHMGVADLPACKPGDFLCRAVNNAARFGVYTAWAQNNLVQAQYFRDPAQLPAYLATNHFLTSINNEIEATINTTYADNFSSLSHLVLVLFSQDKTVVPKESSWFGSYAPPEEELEGRRNAEEKTIIPMRLQPLYLLDLIGLRTLDERGKVFLETCEGTHMQLSTGCWEPLVKRFVGGRVR